MLFKSAVLLLVAWPVAWMLHAVGVHPWGQPSHLLLLVGLLLMLLAFAKDREAAMRPPRSGGDVRQR